MTTTVQTDTSTTTGQAAGADNQGTAAKGADDKATGATTDTTALTGGEGEGEGTALTGKPDGKDQGQASGESTKGAASEAEIEVKLPEGVELDAKLIEGYKGVAKEVGLDSAKATKLVTWFADQQQKASEALVADHQKQSQGWWESIKADKEFGGAEFEKSMAAAQGLIRKYGGGEQGSEVIADLRTYGLGNLPSFFKMLARIAKATGEDTTAMSRSVGGGTAPGSDKEFFDQLYDKSHRGQSPV
jgi:hypothetical protein